MTSVTAIVLLSGAPVVAADDVEFEVTNISPAIEPGGAASVTIEIAHTGEEVAYSTESTITAGGGVVIDGGSANDVLGDIEPDEIVPITVTATAGSSVSPGEKPLTVALSYEDDDGESSTTVIDNRTITVHRSSFSIVDFEDTLAVGYDGQIFGTIKNDGERTVENAVLTIVPRTTTMYVEDSSYALPTLEPGDTASFAYPVDVAGHADAGIRPVQFFVEHATTDGTTIQSGPLHERVVVDERGKEFSIRTVEAERQIDTESLENDTDSIDNQTTERGNASRETVAAVPTGESIELVLEITNERPETLSNIDAQLYANSPLRVTEDSAFVNELAPGESAELVFGLAASSEARINKTYPVELDFEYENERGGTTLSRVYQHPVTVTAPTDDGGLPLWMIFGVPALAAAAIGTGFYLRRR